MYAFPNGENFYTYSFLYKGITLRIFPFNRECLGRTHCYIAHGF